MGSSRSGLVGAREITCFLLMHFLGGRMFFLPFLYCLVSFLIIFILFVACSLGKYIDEAKLRSIFVNWVGMANKLSTFGVGGWGLPWIQ